MKKLHLTAAIASIAMLGALTQRANAQETGEEATLEEVVVTGSRIFGQEQTTSPLVQVTTEDFFENPSVTISEFLGDNVTSNNVVALATDETIPAVRRIPVIARRASTSGAWARKTRSRCSTARV